MSDARPTLDPVADVIFQIPSLRKQRRYRDIVALVSVFPKEILSAHPYLSIALAGSLSHLRRHADARYILEGARSSIRRSADQELSMRWRLLLGIQYLHTGAVPNAAALLGQTLSAAESTEHLSIVADASNSLGVVHSFRGELSDGIIMFKRALFAWQRLGSAHGIGMAYHNMAMLLRDWGDPADAIYYFDKAELYYSRAGIPEETINLASEKALCHADLGDIQMANLLSERALLEVADGYSTAMVAAAYRVAGMLNAKSGDHIQAYIHLKAGLFALGQQDAGQLRPEILEEIAVLMNTMKHPKADVYYRLALKAYATICSTKHQARLTERFQP